MPLELDDAELAIITKSLSITYDATSKRIDRLEGRHRTEALNELELCDQALTKAKAEQMRRRRGGHVMPIGVDR